MRLALFLVLAGCAVDQSVDTTEQSLARPGDELVWTACPDDSKYVWYPTAECATVDVPLDREHPHRGTIPQFVARLPAASGHATHQVWIFDGGPGSSGEELFEGLIDYYASVMPDADLYVPAHRGTGRSAGLACAGEGMDTPNNVDLTPAEWFACRDQLIGEWGVDGLHQFTISNATDDFAELIQLAHVPGQDVIIYGLSYGTNVVWRLLARHPHVADAAIQDSVVSPGEIYQSREDQYADPIFRQFARICADDSFCRSKLGPDPFARITAVSHAVSNGHCAAAGFTPASLRIALGDLLVGWNVRIYALAIPYRLERCNEEDVAALQHFVAFYFAGYDLDGYSNALDVNISFSEFWEHPSPSPATLKARAEHQIAAIDYGYERADISAAWPRYPEDHRDPDWPHIDIPMLMINGTLDIETPLPTALVAHDHYHGPHQTFVELPLSPHAGGYQSPVDEADVEECGMDMMGSFVANPHAPVDTSCIARMRPIVFDDERFPHLFFGTTNVWEN